MNKKYYLLLPVYFGFFIVLGVYEVLNPPFSTDSIKIGDNEIKLSTTPPIPEVGKETKIHLRVLDQNGNLVDSFRMGLQIFYNDALLRSFPATTYPAGSWDIGYVFQESGNHVVRIDLYNLKTGGITSNAFNLSVLSFYNTMFSYLITAGIAGVGGIIGAIFIFQKFYKNRTK
ncbi:MAG: hypothetical protein ABI340_09020 [Nitrososphaera sp.]|jgi:hypothetical protein